MVEGGEAWLTPGMSAQSGFTIGADDEEDQLPSVPEPKKEGLMKRVRRKSVEMISGGGDMAAAAAAAANAVGGVGQVYKPGCTAGWLMKRGHVIKNWKKRWFVLDWPALRYYESPDASEPKGGIDCRQVHCVPCLPAHTATAAPLLRTLLCSNLGSAASTETASARLGCCGLGGQATLNDKLAAQRTGKQFCFGIFHPTQEAYYLQAQDQAEMMMWINEIRHEPSVGLIDFDQLKKLGEGQYGTVFLVRHRVSQKLLAMKVLSKNQTVRDDAVENTKTERQVLRQIRHPFIVQLQYAFQTPESLYMVMDYVNCGDLYEHMQKVHHFAEEVARVWLAEISLALGYLHDLGVVFRDLKP